MQEARLLLAGQQRAIGAAAASAGYPPQQRHQLAPVAHAQGPVASYRRFPLQCWVLQEGARPQQVLRLAYMYQRMEKDPDLTTGRPDASIHVHSG